VNEMSKYKWIEIVKKGIEPCWKHRHHQLLQSKSMCFNVAEITTIYRRWCLTFSGIGLKFQVW
jgi:hypothetical protein